MDFKTIEEAVKLHIVPKRLTEMIELSALASQCIERIKEIRKNDDVIAKADKMMAAADKKRKHQLAMVLWIITREVTLRGWSLEELFGLVISEPSVRKDVLDEAEGIHYV